MLALRLSRSLGKRCLSAMPENEVSSRVARLAARTRRVPRSQVLAKKAQPSPRHAKRESVEVASSPSGGDDGEDWYSQKRRRQQRQRKSSKRFDVEDDQEEVEPLTRRRPAPKPKKAPVRRVASLPDRLTVRELALRSGVASRSLLHTMYRLGVVGQGTQLRKKGSAALLAELGAESREPGKQTIPPRVIAVMAETVVVDAETAELVMLEFDIESVREVAEFEDETRTEYDIAQFEQDLANDSLLPERPPVVTVMGHVDHGKTTLLDSLRSTAVAASEAGGITQRVTAFSVSLSNLLQNHSGGEASPHERVVFLDTPGHEAFTSMRRHGTSVTDVVVLVVAATDGVRAQTVEAIELARAASVPVVVALTKCDVVNVPTEEVAQRVSDELAVHGLSTELSGGDAQIVPVTAPLGVGLPELVESLLLQAELSSEMGLRADPDARGEAVVIESMADKKLGSVADIIVRWGTMRVGDFVVAGEHFGRIRSLLDPTTQQPLRDALPSTPVRLVGLRSSPHPGQEVLVVPTEGRAREVAGVRERRRRQTEMAATQFELDRAAADQRVESEEKQSVESSEDNTEDEPVVQDAVVVPIVLKADTDGSLDALQFSIESLALQIIRQPGDSSPGSKLPEGSEIKMIRKGVGPIFQQDVDVANSADAQIFGFNVRAANAVVKHAERNGVKMSTQRVLYNLLDDVKLSLQRHLPLSSVVKVTGVASVLKVFTMNARRRSEEPWTVAGCRVAEGTISVASRIRVLREGEVIHEGSLSSLRSGKDEVKVVQSGVECGISLATFADFQDGDRIEVYDLVAEELKL